MSTERASNQNRPLKPSIASNRNNARTPIAPRVAAVANTIASGKPITPRASPTVRSEPPTPRVKQTTTPASSAIANGNVTPRSSARSSRVDSPNSTPVAGTHTPNAQRPKPAALNAQSDAVRGGLGISASVPARTHASRPNSLASDSGRPLLVRSPGSAEPVQASFGNSGFFHASDAPKPQEALQKQPEPKKPATFFYADGQKEAETASPVLSAVSDQRSTGPWIRSDSIASPPTSPPMLSPSLSALSSTSSFFVSSLPQGGPQRPGATSKENIHLSYRKGASQIFGTRPIPSTRTTASSTDLPNDFTDADRKANQDASLQSAIRHHKSPSLSSIESGTSPISRRRSATTAKAEPGSSPLANEAKAATIPRMAKPQAEISSIHTSLELTSVRSPPDGALSPTKAVSDFAIEARRERKVLDLEISNSSLLAINTSLEREVRRQKAELKRFRRLSRAGRFSFPPGERSIGRVSDGLSVVGEEDEDGDMFGPPSGLSELYDDMSDDDDESLASSGEPMSPSSQSHRERDRLAKDEKRLQVDLEKHKELLVQSQAMNQSIKRCMYATEDMIREGKKALDYHVRVSDVKLGGRVLSSHGDDDEFNQEIEVEDDLHDDGVDHAKGFLEVWGGVGRPSFESSEGGDRDSGIEVDRPPQHGSLPMGYKIAVADSGRPPGDGSVSS